MAKRESKISHPSPGKVRCGLPTDAHEATILFQPAVNPYTITQLYRRLFPFSLQQHEVFHVELVCCRGR